MNIRPAQAFSRCIEWLIAAPRRSVGVAFTRLGLAIAGLHFYLSNYGDRHLLWGPASYSPREDFLDYLRTGGGKSLYIFTTTTLSFELVFHLGVLAALAFLLFGGRLLTIAHGVFLWSLYQRNGMLLDGGDNFAQIAIILLVLTENNHHFAIGAARRRECTASSAQPSFRWVAHNAGVVLLVFQVATIYAVAGLWKLIGTRWHSGNALYYITRVDEFTFFPLFRWLSANAILVTLLSYGTILIQLSFLPMILTKYRAIAVAGVTSMHVCIALSMGLVGFGLNMVAGDALCLSNADYARSHARWKQLRAQLAERRPRGRLVLRPRSATVAFSEHRRQGMEVST